MSTTGRPAGDVPHSPPLAQAAGAPDRCAVPRARPLTHLLYLHGFRSSPQSFKARAMGQWLAAQRPDVHWWCPQLPPSPREAMALVFGELARWPVERMAVMGKIGRAHV